MRDGGGKYVEGRVQVCACKSVCLESFFVCLPCNRDFDR